MDFLAKARKTFPKKSDIVLQGLLADVKAGRVEVLWDKGEIIAARKHRR